MSSTDIEFYRRRAIEERERAAMSADSEVAKIHLELAARYDALSEDGDRSLMEQLTDLERRLNEIDSTLTSEREKFQQV